MRRRPDYLPASSPRSLNQSSGIIGLYQYLQRKIYGKDNLFKVHPSRKYIFLNGYTENKRANRVLKKMSFSAKGLMFMKYSLQYLIGIVYEFNSFVIRYSFRRLEYWK